jgi:hypothetical protein
MAFDEQLRQISERIATLEAERARLTQIKDAFEHVIEQHAGALETLKDM